MREYHRNRTEEHKQHLKEKYKGFGSLTAEERKQILEKRKDNPNWWGEEHRRKNREHNQAKAQDPEWRKKQSEATIAYYDRVGRKPKVEKVYSETGYRKRKSKEHCESISNALKGKKKVTKTCEYCNKTISYLNYSRWHGENCKEKQYVND